VIVASVEDLMQIFAPCQHLTTDFFPGWILLLMPKQQCYSNEGVMFSVCIWCLVS